MRVYVDSSAVLRYILNGDTALSQIQPFDLAGSSDLLIIECHRVLQRERMAGNLDDAEYADSVTLLQIVVDGLYVIELGEAVKRRAAGSFPTVIGTLDAIHLASCLLWAETELSTELAIMSYDEQLTRCAQSMGVALYFKDQSSPTNEL